MGKLTPSTVRVRILTEHDDLRLRLRLLLEQPTVEGTASFLEAMEAHLDDEDSLLLPVLSSIDAWGPERARRMREEHAAQRREISWIKARLHAPVGAELAPWLRRFADRQLRDMQAEEQERLSPELLQDTAVTVEIDS